MDGREDDPRSGREAALANDGTLSRRAFLRLPAALAVLAAAAGCRGPSLRDERRRIEIVRAADQLTLRFELENLQIVTPARGPARLMRERPSEPARLTVVMPPQHTTEQAFATGVLADNPARSLVARPTRLVFELPAALRAIDLTVDALLDWSRWSVVWPEQDSGAATATASYLELPGGLTLAPVGPVEWRHAARPVTWRGRTELWHTRLQGANGDAFAVRVLAAETGGTETGNAAIDDVNGPLERRHRDALQGKTAITRTLIASPYGGWLDVRGQWERDRDIQRWEQRIVAGRDTRVLVEGPPGYLYPFGHEAARLSVTERQVDGDGRALLRKSEFIIVKQPTVTYRPGDMPLCSLTAETLLTPALERSNGSAYWINALTGAPVLFHFEGRDWAGNQINVVAQAVFVEGRRSNDSQDASPQDTPDPFDVAERLYAADEDRARIGLSNQRASVAPFTMCERPGDALAACAPCDDEDDRGAGRSPGDTALDLFALRLNGRREDNPAAASRPPFTCTTTWLDASVPALEPYVSAGDNRARFALEDPDGNVGEVFVSVRDPADAIPMSLLGRSERTGGIITPAIGIEGVSRSRGAIGQVARVRDGEPIDMAAYFLDEAQLLGVFRLSDLFANSDDVGSDALPKLVMDIVPDEPKAPTEPDPDAPEADEDAEPEPGYTVSLTLTWTFDIPEFTALPVVDLVATKPDAPMRLALSASIKKHFGGEAPPEDDDTPDDDPAERIEWKVEATATGMTLKLDAFGLGGLNIGIDTLKVGLGPKKPEPKPDPDEPDNDTEADKEEDEKSGVQPEIDFKLGQVRGTGALAFINPLMEALEALPNPLTFGDKPPPPAYPKSLPDATDADIVINVGPIAIPDFSWLQFEVSGISTRLGIGLYLFPQENGKRPDPLFTLRIASADKPILLAAEPWGGTAYIAANFTPAGLTGFQFSLGIVYRATFNFGVADALCSGSITAVYTYIEGAPDGSGKVDQVAIILRLHGSATVAGFIGVSLSMTAVGAAEKRGNAYDGGEIVVWRFNASLTVGLHIAFFTVETTFTLDYTMEESGARQGDTLQGAGVPAAGGDGEAAWLAYRRAFAAAA